MVRGRGREVERGEVGETKRWKQEEGGYIRRVEGEGSGREGREGRGREGREKRKESLELHETLHEI